MSYVRDGLINPQDYDSRAPGNPEFGIGGQAPPAETYSTKEQLESETLTVEVTAGSRRSSIMELKAAMAVQEQPGDQFVLDCLDEDIRIVESGGKDELIAETYPELPARIQGLVDTIDGIEEAFEEELVEKLAEITKLGEARVLIDSLLKNQTEDDLALVA